MQSSGGQLCLLDDTTAGAAFGRPAGRGAADLYAAYRSDLLRYFRNRGHNRDDAEDFTQDVYLRLSVCDLSLINRQPVAMVFRIARFVSVEAYRDRARRIRLGYADSSEVDLASLRDARPDPEEQVCTRAELRFVLDVCQTIPRRRREAFLLHRLHGYSHDEIAQMQRISIKTVEKHVASGARNFEARLQALRATSGTCGRDSGLVRPR